MGLMTIQGVIPLKSILGISEFVRLTHRVVGDL